MTKTSKYVYGVEHIPQCEHWVILTNQSINIPGDERSRTNPGHGYPESTERVMTYESFTNEEEFKTELHRRLKSDLDYHTPTRTMGIHVAGVLAGRPTIELKETS